MRKTRFLAVVFLPGFWESYGRVSLDCQKATDKTILALIKQEPTPGMRPKPILPDKYFYEVRINQSDRLIYRVDSDGLRLADIVSHDDIGRYGQRPTPLR